MAKNIDGKVKEMNLQTVANKTKLRGFSTVLVMIVSLLIINTMIIPFASVNTEALYVPDLIEKGSGYTCVLYNNTNGLPTSESNTAVQTSDGFIWIGGYSGLIRYNGNEFYRYPSTTGISSVVCLYVDSKDRLWIGTNDSGLAVMNGTEFKFYSRKDGLSSVSVRDITEDNDGNIIFSTTMGVAYVDKDGKLHNVEESRINKEYICDMETDENGTVYGVTQSGSFFTMEKMRITALYQAKDFGFEAAESIYPDPDNPGYVYVGTDGHSEILYGNIKNKMSDKKIISVAPHKTVNVMKSINGNIWCGTDAGIGYFEKGEYIVLEDLPMTSSVDDIMVDHEGNLWFCSGRQGLMKIVENRFIDISGIVGLPNMVVNSTCKCNDDLYIATDKGLKILDSNYREKENELTGLLSGNRIRCITKDKDQNLWFCTYSENGLVKYDPKTNKYSVYNESKGLLSNRVRTVKELSDGKMAVATMSGVNIISGEKIVSSFNDSNGISNLEILSIEEGEDGKLFFGSDGDGIYTVDGNKVTRLGNDDGLSSEVILRIKKDPAENIYWIVTSNSIAYMKDGKIRTIENFPYSNNYDIYSDNHDRMWILSSNGIYVVSKKAILKDEKLDYELLDTKCGLPSVPTANSYSYKDENGTLYLSATSGVSSININNQKSDNTDILLSVSYINVDDKEIKTNDIKEIHIPYNCKRLTIDPNVFTYTLNNPQISYYLEGFDEKTFMVKKQDLKQVSYTNLKGGKYTFHLSIINTITGKTEKTITLTIVKDMAFYEQMWFRIVIGVGIVLLTVGSVFLYYKRKTALLLKKQENNKRLINEMTAAFAKCVDIKDSYTNGHSSRVAEYASMFARRLGKSEEEIERIYNIALLHDIGKISVPIEILNKPGRLNDEEFAVMKTHPTVGHDILKNITIEPDLALGAQYHHERIDGKGYPAGLKGDEIPEIAKIIAVADTFDAMYSTRPYRKKMSMDKIVAEIKRCSGTQLDSKVVDVFLELADEGVFEEKKTTQQDGTTEDNESENKKTD